MPYLRRRERSLLGGIPATLAGALLSIVVGGPALLIASGVVLVIVGLRGWFLIVCGIASVVYRLVGT